MVKIRMILKQNWPLAGKMRREGEILAEGVSAIDGITPDKILNAFLNDVVRVEIAPADRPPAKKRGGKK